nr:hypothetical protein [Chthoniobacterales bacterium]
MDRQAWIAVTLCVLGLIGWQVYMTTHAPPPRPAIVMPSPTPPNQASPSPSASALASGSALPASSPAPQSAAAYVEKTETLRNADVELRLTNRGGAISEARLVNHAAEKGQKVVLNAADRTPIGALIENPAAPALPEFAISPATEGGVQFSQSGAAGVSVVKRFAFAPSAEKKDNFVVEMNVEFRNESQSPYKNSGYFVTLGSAQPIHPNDLPSYTRLVWCVDGKAKGTDVG